MSKKSILMLVVLAVAVLAGGFFVYRHIQETEKRKNYEASSDKIADEFIAAVLARDTQKAMAHFSTDLRANYGESYWQTTVFAELESYKGTPNLHAKAAVQPTSPEVPNRYDPELNQQPTQYEYDFKVNNATYRLMVVIFRQAGVWKINEVSGGYVQ